MYAFRKPFTAASFSDELIFGIDQKTILVSSQVLGYLLSKIAGIRIIAEMPSERRATALLSLIALAHLALLLFAVVPSPFHVVCIFFNGIPLGLVFGLVLGFLEGRKLTEALSAGLCASFIMAGGFSKTTGSWLLQLDVSERWMPFAAGLLYYIPLGIAVWMLTCIPPPNSHDIALRSRREPMTSAMRRSFLYRHALGLSAIAGVYFLTTILRSIRDDFGPELWISLGSEAQPSDFAWTDFYVAVGVLVLNGLSVLIVDNRRALLSSFALSAFGACLILAAIWSHGQSQLSPMGFMTMVGLGLYLPYVAIHTTIFERIIATTRDRGNIGFLMYVVDSVGYLGYVGVMFGRQFSSEQSQVLPFFISACLYSAIIALVLLLIASLYFARVGKGRIAGDVTIDSSL